MRFLTGVFLVLFALECAALTKIACIGNSITYGANLSDPSLQSYPGKLQKLLGTSNYTIQNDGVHPDSSGQDTIAHVVYRALTAPVKITVPNPRQELMVATNPSLIMTSLEKINLQSKPFGMIKEITIFDCSGHLLRKQITAKQTVSITGDFGLPRGVYIIKTSERQF